jgi:hypothetical protein
VKVITNQLSPEQKETIKVTPLSKQESETSKSVSTSQASASEEDVRLLRSISPPRSFFFLIYFSALFFSFFPQDELHDIQDEDIDGNEKNKEDGLNLSYASFLVFRFSFLSSLPPSSSHSSLLFVFFFVLALFL